MPRVSLAHRREHLLEAAREEFVRNGLAGATTRTIAATAGTTEAVMYRLYSSKEELFEEAVCEPLEQLVLRIAGTASQFTTSGPDGTPELTPEVQAGLFELMVQALPLLGAAILNQDGGSAFFTTRIAPLIDLAVRAVATMLRGFPNADIEPEVLFMAIFGMHMGLAIEATRAGIELDVDTVGRDVVDVLTHGLTGP